MHRSWTCSPNEELEEWVGGCTFFFSFGAPSSGLLDTFQNLPRIAWAERALRGVATPTVPPTPSSTALLLSASLHQLQNCYKP